MTFIVALMALLVERFFDWGHLRRWDWYVGYRLWVEQKLKNQPPAWVLTIAVLPFLIAVLLIQYVFIGKLYGFLSLLFHFLVLLYCMGPQNLWADTFACINALAQGDAGQVAEKLKTMFGITEMIQSQTFHQQFLRKIFIAANVRVFAVVFWYAILGPAGALFYRLMVLASPLQAKEEEEVMPLVVKDAYHVETVLDWLPVRVFTFIFALGGHFVKTLAAWRKDVLQGLGSNEAMLADCGLAALGIDEAGSLAEDGSVERNAISLLDRVFVILLVAVAVGVIVI